MAKAAFRYLFKPIRIGPMEVRNRVYIPAHALFYAEPVPGEPMVRLPSERHAYYLAERAKGGVGLIIMEVAAVHSSAEMPTAISLWDERVIPGLKLIADMVHEHGAKIFCQLWHCGHQAWNPISRSPSLCPSQTPMVGSPSAPKEMEIEEIKEVERAYGVAARNVVAGGFDGVEIHASHGYLPEQFLSAFWNKRVDEYGGSLENRMRFLLEVIDQVRQKVGDKVAVGLRMNADELVPGGNSHEDMKVVARKLEETGKLDFLDVDIGLNSHSLHIMIAPMYVPAGHQVDYIAGIKKAVKEIPVLGCAGRITDLTMAEKILADGKMDMVGAVRGHIADPELVNKAREGRLDDVRACIACNEFCLGHFSPPVPVACQQNPAVGREKEWGIGTLKPAGLKKRVLVVGGGPGGMETARVAALRGHEVHLHEKDPELGGRLRLEASLPGRSDIETAVRWYDIQLKKLGVKVSLGKEVTPELVNRLNPDVVVVATGSSWLRSGFSALTAAPIEGWEQKNVVTPEQVLRKEVEIGAKVVILDCEGMETAPGIAELLATAGKSVEIVTPMPGIALGLAMMAQMFCIYERTLKAGVQITPNSLMVGISGATVTLVNTYTLEIRQIEDVNNVVMVTAKASNNELYKKLKGKVMELYCVGDAVSPRRFGDAVYQGHKVGREI